MNNKETSDHQAPIRRRKDHTTVRGLENNDHMRRKNKTTQNDRKDTYRHFEGKEHQASKSRTRYHPTSRYTSFISSKLLLQTLRTSTMHPANGETSTTTTT